ncbi:hypothetical protein GCM10023189_56850 [Nibrella saemangeumensis]|uniref:DUF2029 domain-containing protein n=2 Tax=Nibrella saemangeumensis TaxID=1084526 RepID=A0ABP8NR04_9BACT
MLVLLLWQTRKTVRIAPSYHTTLFLLSFLCFRIIPFILVYVILDYDTRSDVPMFYDSAVEALKLKVVYREFDTAYSPLFPYLTALPLMVWNSPKAILLLLMLTEGVTLWLTYKLYLPSVDRLRYSDDLLRKIMLYLMLPIPFVLSVLGGQEDILMWLFGAWALLIWRRKRDDLWIGIVLGLGMVVTKAILVLTLIPVFFLVQNRFRYVLGLIIVGLPSLVIMYALAGLEFLEPIQQANDPRTPNLWTILRPALGDIVPLGRKSLNWVGLVSILGLASFVGYAYRRQGRFFDGFIVLWIVTYAFMMIVQQSSLANYAYIFIMPLVFAAISFDKKSHLLLLLAFNFTIVVQPPIWWGMDMPLFTSLADFANGWALTEYLLEIIIVGCLLYIINLFRTLPKVSP